MICHSPGPFSSVLFCSHRSLIKSFVLTLFAMGLQWASGGHENPIKPHEFGGMYFNLKGWSGPGPTKLSLALGAESTHKGGRLQHNLKLSSFSLVTNKA